METRSTLSGNYRRREFCVLAVSLALLGFLAANASAQVAPLPHRGKPIELVDPEERISGNAATGLVVVNLEDHEPSRDNLWAYIGEPVPAAVRLQISSVDGRYFAEIEYDTDASKSGWIPLQLDLAEFNFLRSYAVEWRDNIAALLTDRNGATVYPVWWGPRHSDTNPTDELPMLSAETKLRAYINTERATAFVLERVGNAEAPSICIDVPGDSAFKFNAICEVSLAGINFGDTASQEHGLIDGFDVYRRAGTRSLLPITIDLNIAY